MQVGHEWGIQVTNLKYAPLKLVSYSGFGKSSSKCWYLHFSLFMWIYCIKLNQIKKPGFMLKSIHEDLFVFRRRRLIFFYVVKFGSNLKICFPLRKTKKYHWMYFKRFYLLALWQQHTIKTNKASKNTFVYVIFLL